MGEQILALASALSGGAGEEKALLAALCTAAETAWTARLRADIAPADCGAAFPCAAALTAAADLASGRGGDGVAAFTAGSVAVHTRTAAEAAALARAMRETAERLMAPYAASPSFAVRGVRG